MSTSTDIRNSAPAAAPNPAPRGARPASSRIDTPIAGIPFSRLVRVEWRKQIDTLAGRWLIITIAAVAALIVGISFFTLDDLDFEAFLGMALMPAAMLIPIIGVMTATSEWSQRTAMTTFALEPRRGRVVAAKGLASLLLGMVVLVLSVAFAAGAHQASVMVNGDGDWSIPSWMMVGIVITVLLYVLQGFAFGLAFLNTPVAIVAFLALPMVWTILTSLVTGLQDVAAWLDLNQTFGRLMDSEMPNATEWAQAGASAALWIVLPLAIGTWRVLRREVK